MSVAQQQLQDNRDFIRGAQNEALSQALTDAGFGIQLINADAQAAAEQKKANAAEKKAAETVLPCSGGAHGTASGACQRPSEACCARCW